ncbi:MAG: phosphatidylserine decarboxylase family protein [Chitinophagales bacterium]
MTIHKEGFKILTGVVVALTAINLIMRYFYPGNQQMLWGVFIASAILFLSIASFFRKPRRVMFLHENYVLAPADGRIVAIEETVEEEYFKDRRILVSVFMSPSNVHVNWNPIGGIVKYVKYHAGKNLVAWHPKSSLDNERNTVVIDDNGNEILIRQIAGFLARRIVHYMDVGQEVAQGKELGFIKFGSRVDLFLPIDSVIHVDLRQKVKGGQSILAQIP